MKVRKWKRMFSIAAAAAVIVTALPVLPVSAVQSNDYRDPLEKWISSESRTNELDINAVVTSETVYCKVCDKHEVFRVFRTPEYTKDGVSSAERGVIYSDGTMTDGSTKGTIRQGNIYTGYHWTKSVCSNCGGMNTNNDYNLYGYGLNIYYLYDCSQKFMKPLDTKTEYESRGGEYHTVKTDSGNYCAFCHGTVHNPQEKLVKHTLKRNVEAEPADKRFKVTEKCALCGYEDVLYKAAGTIVESYSGKADGKGHSIKLSSYSDSDIDMTVLYGKEHGHYELESAPSYKKAGKYPVYYRITYDYSGGTMFEEGVAYVTLSASLSGEGGSGADGSDGKNGLNVQNENDRINTSGTEGQICGCGDADCCCSENCDGTDCSECGTHNFRLADKTETSCSSEGFDRYICTNCGKTEKRNIIKAAGHKWGRTVIKDADCAQEGKTVMICSQCGNAKIEIEPKTDHKFVMHAAAATCISPGYTIKECTICGEKSMTDIKNVLPHNYKEKKIESTCLAGGHTTHICEGCGSSFITDYTDPLGHKFDKKTKITDPTCSSEGVTQLECSRCGYSYLSAAEAKGHIPGNEATCTMSQTCEKCKAVIKEASGHKYKKNVVKPTCDEMGYTEYTCSECGHTYKEDFAEPSGHKAGVWFTGIYSRGESSSEGYGICETCGKLIKSSDTAASDSSDKTDGSGSAAVTDSMGRASAGDLTVIVTDTESGAFVKGARIVRYGDETIGIVLPSGKTLNYEERTTVTVIRTDTGKPVRGIKITIKDKSDNSDSDISDRDGQITVPAGYQEANVMESHKLYMYGYPDSTFRPDGNMTRSEAAAVFARLLAYDKNENIPVPAAGTRIFADVAASEWYAGDVRYLVKYGILSGDGSGMFRPDDEVTRSELTAIAAQFARVRSSSSGKFTSRKNTFSDVKEGYWADPYIDEAYSKGWIAGYGDGTFRGDNPITRAEMITITNNLLGRNADSSYIKKNARTINRFSDVSSSHWAFCSIMEASTDHRSNVSQKDESWINIML